MRVLLQILHLFHGTVTPCRGNTISRSVNKKQWTRGIARRIISPTVNRYRKNRNHTCVSKPIEHEAISPWQDSCNFPKGNARWRRSPRWPLPSANINVVSSLFARLSVRYRGEIIRGIIQDTDGRYTYSAMEYPRNASAAMNFPTRKARERSTRPCSLLPYRRPSSMSFAIRPQINRIAAQYLPRGSTARSTHSSSGKSRKPFLQRR